MERAYTIHTHTS